MATREQLFKKLEEIGNELDLTGDSQIAIVRLLGFIARLLILIYTK